MTPSTKETMPVKVGITVAGTDEDMRYAYVWLKDPDAPLPTEDEARAAIVATAADDWDLAFDSTLMRPWKTCWFKDGPNDEDIACDETDPDRRSRFWLWDISKATDAAYMADRGVA
jgi:hypothetical protein